MVFAMYGALDMFTILGDAHARAIWDAGVDTPAANIGKYDAQTRSYYSEGPAPRLVLPFYQQLHVELLRELYLLAGREVFHTCQARFAADLLSPPPGMPK